MDSSVTTPAIVISTIGDCLSVWKEVLLGIEEEGIPFVIQNQAAGRSRSERMAGGPPVSAAGRHRLQ
ncbi:propanediol utilization: diol dehydratase reactivation [Citrobacter amalonaticus]|nr:propanediol utilization: diol dehydratase reactivation [Citrobacter amalonaticus]